MVLLISCGCEQDSPRVTQTVDQNQTAIITRSKIPPDYLDVYNWSEWAKPPLCLIQFEKGEGNDFICSRNIITIDDGGIVLNVDGKESIYHKSFSLTPYRGDHRYPCPTFNVWHHYPNGNDCTSEKCPNCGKTICGTVFYH